MKLRLFLVAAVNALMITSPSVAKGGTAEEPTLGNLRIFMSVEEFQRYYADEEIHLYGDCWATMDLWWEDELLIGYRLFSKEDSPPSCVNSVSSLLSNVFGEPESEEIYSKPSKPSPEGIRLPGSTRTVRRLNWKDASGDYDISFSADSVKGGWSFIYIPRYQFW